MTIRKRTSLIYLFIVSLVACSQSGGKIDENNDVIAKDHKVSNLHKFEKFVTNVEKGAADKIRIVNYTHEGDPIFQTLEYDGNEISYSSDSSYDKFAGKDKGIYSDTCKNIIKDIREDIRYTLHDCKKEIGHNGYHLFSLPLNYPHLPLQELEVGDSSVSVLAKTVPLVQQRGYNDIEFGSVYM